MLVAAPTIAAWLKTNPKQAPIIYALLGFLPFVLGPWHLIVAPYAMPLWSGYAKGWEISFLDAIAIGVILGTQGRWPVRALLIPFVAYIAAVGIALYQAAFFNIAMSSFIQLIRVFLVFLAVSRVVVNERGERAVLTGMILGLTVQAGYAIWARAGGALQTGGSLGHQNLLGFMSHLVVMPAFAMFLSGRWQRIALLGIFSGLTVVILTASRATIAFSAVGLALTLLISMAIRFTGRKAALGLVSIVILGCSYPLARATLDRRFEVQKTTFFNEDIEREAFKKAAFAMLAAHPMGVGPNHYVFIANGEGYSARAGVAWRTESRSTNVHNSYLLVAVETGYLGLIAMLALLGSALWCAFATAFRFRHRYSVEILIGLGCGLVAMSLHSFYEWMFVVFPTQYLFATSLGLISGLRRRFLSNPHSVSRGGRSVQRTPRLSAIANGKAAPIEAHA